MKRFLILPILLASLACLAASALPFPSYMFKSIEPLVYVTGVNSCTAFSVNQHEGWWMTAGHCLVEGQTFEGAPLVVVASDEKLDLGVISGSHRPAFKMAFKASEVGEDVMTIGFPFGNSDPLVLFGKTAGRSKNASDTHPTAIQHIASGGGASGGPTLDSSGKVICVHQLGNGGLSGCNTFEDFKSFAARYFETLP